MTYVNLQFTETMVSIRKQLTVENYKERYSSVVFPLLISEWVISCVREFRAQTVFVKSLVKSQLNFQGKFLL